MHVYVSPAARGRVSRVNERDIKEGTDDKVVVVRPSLEVPAEAAEGERSAGPIKPAITLIISGLINMPWTDCCCCWYHYCTSDEEEERRRQWREVSIEPSCLCGIL